MPLIHDCAGRRRILLLCVMLGGVFTTVQGQFLLSSVDSSNAAPRLTIGMTRVGFTSVFTGDAVLYTSVFGGVLQVQQRYRGVSLLTNIASFRDDEVLRIEWRYPVWEFFSIVPHCAWDVSNDSRSLGISRLERLRAAVRGAYQNSLLNAEAYGGVEQATQLGITEAGTAAGGRIMTMPITLGEFNLIARVEAEDVRLAVRRNADLNATLELVTPSAPTQPLGVQLLHRRQRRDYYTTLGISSTVALEHRTEQRSTVRGYLQQQLWQFLSLSIHSDISLLRVERAFSAPTIVSALTFVRRRLDELNISTMATATIQVHKSLHGIGGRVERRSEVNAVLDLFPPPSAQLVEDVRVSERMRDNESYRLQVWTMHQWYPRNNDTLHITAQGTIVRYDTPSPLNYDDRDELSQLIRAAYTSRFSPALIGKMTFEYAATHFVFLRAQRSALNNWNRSFRLSAHFTYVTSAVLWNPQWEILAQYTVYDFEGLRGVPQSFSFRQIAYRDSIQIRLPTGVVEGQAFVRWFLRGDFSWAQFAERPVGDGHELFARVMVWREFGAQWSIGAGGRWYSIQQTMVSSGLAVLAGSQQSIAPDVSIRLRIEAIELQVGGWYEIRRVRGGGVQIVPNMQLSLTRQL
ncbi:MAG: hypothetical protein N2971_04070 [Chlorobi bacterium]|nr:hypothetical protein [Chlorobiota bacterium]